MHNYDDNSEFVKQRQKKKETITVLASLFLVTILLILLFVFVIGGDLVKQIIGAVTLSLALSLSFGWLAYIYNEGLFSSISHGFNSLMRIIFRRERVKYFDYIQSRKKVSRQIIKVSFIYCLFLVVVLIVLFLIHYN